LNLVLAFIFATAWAYLACAVYTAIGRSPLVDIDTWLQAFFYLCCFGIFIYVAYNPGIWLLNLLLGILYCFLAMGSFIGYPQRWSSYWKPNSAESSSAAQIGMALWDLALAVAFISLI